LHSLLLRLLVLHSLLSRFLIIAFLIVTFPLFCIPYCYVTSLLHVTASLSKFTCTCLSLGSRELKYVRTSVFAAFFYQYARPGTRWTYLQAQINLSMNCDIGSRQTTATSCSRD